MTSPLITASSSVARATSDLGGYQTARGLRGGEQIFAALIQALAFEGRVFVASDGDANDTVTGQTSFADTAPSFLLRVPAGTTCLPLSFFLNQTGTVAGGVIAVNFAISSTVDAYASGGTSELVFGARTDKPIANACTLYTTPTCTTALLTKQLRSYTIGQDVSTAEGAIAELVWTPERQGHPLLLVGPCSLAVFTSAATTGPTWNWSASWAEMPSTAVV